MSAPTGVTATVSQSGGPGSYVITYSWSATGATSFTYSLNSIIWGVTQTVVGPTTTSSAGSGTYTNTVTGASYQLVVSASNANGTSSATSQQVSVYNPYGGPQGVQGYQGVQGDQGATGPTGLQGSRGLQGLMEINNYTVANQITTTAADTAHLNANSGLTWNGATLNIGGNITGVTTINASTIGGVGITAGAITASSINNGANTFTVSSPSTSNINTLTVGAATGTGKAISTTGTISATSTSAHTLGLVNFTNGAITGASSINNTTVGGVTLSNNTLVASNTTVTHRLGNVTFNSNTISWAGETGGDTGISFASEGAFNVVNNGNVTAQFYTGGLNMNTSNIVNAGTIGCGAITAPTTGNTINSVIINAGAVSGVSTLAMTGALSGGTTISNTSNTQSSNFTTPTASSNSIGGVVLSNSRVAAPSSGAHNLGVINFSNGAITGATTISNSSSTTSGSFSTTGTVTCGAISAPTTGNTINSVIINAGAISGVSTLAMTGALSGATTITASGVITGPTLRSPSTTLVTSARDGAREGAIRMFVGSVVTPTLSFTVPAGTFMCAFSVRNTSSTTGHHYSGLAFFNPANATPTYIQMAIAYAIQFTLNSASGDTLVFGSFAGNVVDYIFTCFTIGIWV